MGKVKSHFSLGIPMMGIPRAETLHWTYLRRKWLKTCHSSRIAKHKKQ